MLRPKLVALALAGIMALVGFAGCTGGEGDNAPSPMPTHLPVVTEAPDLRATVSPATVASTRTPVADIWTQLVTIPERNAEVEAHYVAVVTLTIECGLPESIYNRVENDPDILAGIDRQLEAYEVLIEAQEEAQAVDFDNPGTEGYETLFRFLSAHNELQRANRELLTIEKAIYESHGCPMPPNPDWMTGL